MCNFCDKQEDCTFVALNGDTKEYSGIEISLHHTGQIRARTFNEDGFVSTQDWVGIDYCPKCGERLVKTGGRP